MNLDEFTEYADRVVNREIPPPLLQELHMGIIVLPEEKQDKYQREQYIMGEYVSNEMGNHIVLYYGSFAAVLEDQPRKIWEEEIRETVKHEVWHHVEALSGNEKLARQEMKEWEEMMAQTREKPASSDENTYTSPGFSIMGSLKKMIAICTGLWRNRNRE